MVLSLMGLLPRYDNQENGEPVNDCDYEGAERNTNSALQIANLIARTRRSATTTITPQAAKNPPPIARHRPNV